MATQWAAGPLHPNGKIRVSLVREVLFAIVVHSVGVSEYGHYTEQVIYSFNDNVDTQQ